MSIREVRAAIASNRDEAQTCVAQLHDARDRVERMRDRLQAVAADSDSQNVDDCLAGFDGARETLQELSLAIQSAQAVADEYAARI